MTLLSPERLVELAQVVVAVVRNGHPALVGVDGAEGEVLRGRLALGQDVKERGFPAGQRQQRSSIPIMFLSGRSQESLSTFPMLIWHTGTVHMDRAPIL